MAQDNRARQTAPASEIATDVEKALAEILRLRGWLKIISDCNAESTAELRFARRVRFLARRALDGERV